MPVAYTSQHRFSLPPALVVEVPSWTLSRTAMRARDPPNRLRPSPIPARPPLLVLIHRKRILVTSVPWTSSTPTVPSDQNALAEWLSSLSFFTRCFVGHEP